MRHGPDRATEDAGFWRASQAASERYLPLGKYLLQVGDRGPEATVSVTTNDLPSLDAFRVDGFKVTLAIGPAVDPDYEKTRCAGNKTAVLPHLGLITLASFLRRFGAEVRIVDHFVGDHFTDEEKMIVSDRDRVLRVLGGKPDPGLDRVVTKWERLLRPEDADLLGFSSCNEADPLSFVLLKRKMRDLEKKTPVVVGGYWDHDDSRRWMGELDARVHGEGEVPLLLLCHALGHGRPVGWIPGVASEGVKRSRVAHSMNVHPEPSLEGFALQDYSYETYAGFSGVTVPYQISAGCPHNCAYCNNAHKQRYKARDPGRVARDLEHLHERHGVTQLFLLDSAFNGQRAHAEEVLEGMIASGREWRWCDCARPNRIDSHLLRRMRLAGCEWLNWGYDTLSDRLSTLYGRRVTSEQFGRVLRESSRAGIRNSINVVVGMPNEIEADVEELLSFVNSHRKDIHWIFFLNYCFIPHSDIGKYPERYGLVRRGDEGVDELDGLDWAKRREKGAIFMERIKKRLGRYGYC